MMYPYHREGREEEGLVVDEGDKLGDEGGEQEGEKQAEGGQDGGGGGKVDQEESGEETVDHEEEAAVRWKLNFALFFCPVLTYRFVFPFERPR